VQYQLEQFEIDFSKPVTSKEAKLPLEPFDDNEFESRTPKDWIELATENSEIKGIPAKAIRFNENEKIGF